MTIVFEMRRLSATLIFDLEDRFARRRGVTGRHPRPFGPVKFYVVGQIVGATRRDFDRPWELIVDRNTSGYHLFFGKVKLPDGSVRQSILAPGTYVVRIESDFYEPAEREDVDLSRAQQPYCFDLEARYGYPIPDKVAAGPPGDTRAPGQVQTALRGWVRTASGVPIRGATIGVEGHPGSTTTGCDGSWFFYFPLGQAAEIVTVRARLVDGRTLTQVDIPVQPGATVVVPTIRFA